MRVCGEHTLMGVLLWCYTVDGQGRPNRARQPCSA